MSICFVYSGDAGTPMTRAIAVASTTGCVLSANMNIFTPAIPTSLMMRTTTIAFASGVRGLAPAARKALSDDKIARNGRPRRGSFVQDFPNNWLGKKCCTFPTVLAIAIVPDAGARVFRESFAKQREQRSKDSKGCERSPN
jgi:hypothetical protein